MNLQERIYPQQLVALFALLGMTWVGIAVGLRAGIGLLGAEGCSAILVGEPTVCQSAMIAMNHYTKLALLVGIVALLLGGVAWWYARKTANES